MTRIIDADSHFMEPLDLWEQHIDPKYRSRCLRFEQDPKNNRYTIAVEDFKIDHSGDLSIEELRGVAVGYGSKDFSPWPASFCP